MVSIFRPRRTIDIAPVAVAGLGRFGSALAMELMDHGVEVLGLDASEKLVREMAPFLTQTIQADTTDAAALAQLGLDDVERAVVAIGSSMEASILTASNLVELGVKDVWAKSDTEAHARILAKIGVNHVIRPERDTGRRIAHLLSGHFEDFAEIAQDYGVIKLVPPARVQGEPLNLSRVLEDYHVQLVSVRAEGTWLPLADAVVLGPTDVIVAAGSPAALEKFTDG